MRIMLTGANGQVGWELSRSLMPQGEVISLTRSQCDLSRSETLPVIVNEIKPDVIVNAAAYTAVDKAEEEEELATIINGTSVGVLAEEARKHNALFVHYSTDYVFDGAKSESYTEEDTPNPINGYGRSKLVGEEAIQQVGGRHFIFRTSWVVGAHGNNFIKTILRLAKERDSLNVVADQHGAPTTAALIADVTAQAILNSRLPSGAYHLAPSGYTTWHKLAQYVVSCAQRNGIPLSLNPEQILAIPTADYPTPAKRPANSRLDCTKLCETFGVKLSHWKAGIDRMMTELLSRED